MGRGQNLALDMEDGMSYVNILNGAGLTSGYFGARGVDRGAYLASYPSSWSGFGYLAISGAASYQTGGLGARIVLRGQALEYMQDIGFNAVNTQWIRTGNLPAFGARVVHR